MVVRIKEESWSTPVKVGDEIWCGVAYGNGKYVAVSWYYNSFYGRITTSTDGVTWSTPQQISSSSQSSGAFSDIIFGDGKFVAINSPGYVTTSTDGVTWSTPQQISSTGDNVLNHVAYGNGKFVAIGGYKNADQYSRTSTDGITWTSVKTLKNGLGVYDIIYGNGKFVAVGTSGHITTSTNGTTWSTIQVGTKTWNGITFSDGKFVVVGTSGYVTTSTDGVTWSTPQQVGTHAWSGITYGDGKFIVVGGSGYVTTSTDGVTWSTPQQVGTIIWNGITFGDGKFVAVNGDTSNKGYIATYTPTKKIPYLLTTKSGNTEKKYILTTKKQQINSNYLQVVGSPEISDDLIVSNLSYDNYLSIPSSKIQLYGEIPTSSEYTYFKLSKTPVIEITYNTDQPILFRIPALKINYSDKIGNVWVPQTTEIDFVCNVISVNYGSFQEAYLIPGNTYVFEPGYLGVIRGTSSSGKQIVFNYYYIFYGTGIFRSGSSTIKLEKAQGGGLVMTKPYYTSYETYSNRIDSIQLLTKNDLQIGASDAEFTINLKNSYIRTETGQNIPLDYDIKYYA